MRQGPILSRLDEFTRLHNERYTGPQLAEHFGVALSTVTKWRKRLGLKGLGVRLSPERLARLEAMLDEGMSFKEINRTEGTNLETLAKYFPGRGWTRVEAGRYALMSQRLDQIAA